MIVSYKPSDPADGEPREWEFNAKRVRSAMCIAIEKRWGGGDYEEWRDACLKGDTLARRVLLWHLLKQEHPPFRWEDTPDFYYDELTIEADLRELQEMREQVEKQSLRPGVTEEDRDKVLAAIDAEIAAKGSAEDAGKAAG